MSKGEKELLKLKNSSAFTEDMTLQEYVQQLCGRYTRIFNEILIVNDYDYIYNKLLDKGVIGG